MLWHRSVPSLPHAVPGYKSKQDRLCPCCSWRARSFPQCRLWPGPREPNPLSRVTTCGPGEKRKTLARSLSEMAQAVLPLSSPGPHSLPSHPEPRVVPAGPGSVCDSQESVKQGKGLESRTGVCSCLPVDWRAHPASLHLVMVTSPSSRQPGRRVMGPIW